MPYNIEDLVQKNDLISFAERAGAVFKGHGKEYRSHCPIHGGKNPTGFVVWDDGGKQRWRCYTDVCGAGDVVDFVQAWQKKTFKDAVAFLGGDTFFNPEEMRRLADERHQRAIREREAAQRVEEARRKELQSEEKHLFYHNHMNQYFVDEWVKRGLDECWQAFWTLGGCDDFVVNGDWHTPTLTIPIVDEKYDLMTIRHRLLNPPNPKDKYRPESSGLRSHPFLAYPDLGYDKADVFWVIEGEIKGAVTATINPDEKWQYIGTSGLSNYNCLVDRLFGKNVVVVADPNAEREAGDFCKKVNGRFVELGSKIDDAIVEFGYDGDWLRSIERQARRIR